jgi:putative flippase GtrA
LAQDLSSNFIFMNLRYIKFGFVGVSGMAINLGSLYIFKNFVFDDIHKNFLWLDVSTNLSLFFSILLSILNNFIFNKLWTWSDRDLPDFHQLALIIKLFFRYFSVCLTSVVLQFIFVNLFTKMGINYLISSLISIGMGASINFFYNNKYTFKR